jgi:hypothetical protein
MDAFFIVVTSIFPDGKISRPRLTIFAFAIAKQKYRCAWYKSTKSASGGLIVSFVPSVGIEPTLTA